MVGVGWKTFRGYVYHVTDESVYTFIRKIKKEHLTEEAAKEYIMSLHEAKVAKSQACLPPITIPTKVTDIKSLTFPLYLHSAAIGLRAQHFRGMYFDENNRYINAPKFENQNGKNNYWGVFYSKNSRLSAEEVRKLLEDENDDHIGFDIIETINYKVRYNQRYNLNLYHMCNNLDQLLNWLKHWNDEGLYIVQPSGYYEMGYRGHQSGSLYYLPYQIARDCEIIEPLRGRALAIMWTNGVPFASNQFVQADQIESDKVTVMYITLDDAGVPVSSHCFRE